MEINEGDFVVMLYDYSHTKKKGQLAKVTELHLRDVSVEFSDGKVGSYPWHDVRKATTLEVLGRVKEIQDETQKIIDGMNNE